MSSLFTPVMTMEHLEEIGLIGTPAADRPAGTTGDAKAARPKATAAPVSTSSSSPAAAASAKKAVKAKAAAATAAAASSSAPAAPVEPLLEKSAEELAKMSKDERRAYHQTRRQAELAVKNQGTEQKEEACKLTKAQRRAIQEAQRKAKEDKVANTGEFDELLKDLKLQGLSEDQAREVIAEMAKNEQVVDDDDDDDDGEVEDLEGSVKRWMNEQDQVTKDALHDFNMKVRFQGHVDTTPPDHLRSILHILFEQACKGLDLAAPKLQPTAVAKKAEPLVIRWANLLEPLYGKIGDVLTAADVVVQATHEALASQPGVPEAGQACGVVGCLMAIREIDMIEDEDLLTGCRRVENPSRVMQGFIKFLEDEVEDDDDEDDED